MKFDSRTIIVSTQSFARRFRASFSPPTNETTPQPSQRKYTYIAPHLEPSIRVIAFPLHLPSTRFSIARNPNAPSRIDNEKTSPAPTRIYGKGFSSNYMPPPVSRYLR
ncbi:hypothetical protein FOYG_10933 [Fusarium oxysporum NRRL 32931]|uniref:Uncharacterized protein n=1 Tax=Fusarium oxysporum NRRL 32931 TaxID=660029 RepID=W9HZD6_FUSOX|nr:hypothetical protein FOYG_10933 [Fusarium oxysporum NRRL 32931]